MALIFLEGFDLLSAMPTGSSPGTNSFVAVSSVPEVLLDSSVVAFSDSPSKSLHLQPTDLTHAAFIEAAVSGGTQFICGFNFRYSGALPVGPHASGTSGVACWFGLNVLASPVQQVELGIDSSGVWHITDGLPSGTTYASGTTPLIPGNWYFVEFQVNLNASIGADTCFVKLNGTTEANVPTSTNTIPSNSLNAATTLTTIGLGFDKSTLGVPLDIWIDDFYLFDLSGSTDNTPFGSEHVHSVAPSTLSLVSKGIFSADIASGAATFTGASSSVAKRASSASSTATFTGTATGGTARVASALSSATFSYTAASTPALPSGHVPWIGSRLSQLGNLIPGFGITRGRFIVASASDSFNGMSSPLDIRITDHVVAAVASARFTGTSSSTHHIAGSASDAATFTDQLVIQGHFTNASDVATFTASVSSPPKARVTDSFKFSDLALSGKNRVVSASSSATFSDSVRESKPTVFSQSLSDSFVFLVTYANVHDTSMPCAASDSFTFSDDAEAGGQFGFRSPASDLATYTDAVSVSFKRVLLPIVASAATFTDRSFSSSLKVLGVSAKDSGRFSDFVSLFALHVRPVLFSDTARVSDLASSVIVVGPKTRPMLFSDTARVSDLASSVIVVGPKTRPMLFSDLFRFTDLASSVNIVGPKVRPLTFSDSAEFDESASFTATRLQSTSDSFSFTGVAIGARNVVSASSDSGTFTGAAKSNQFLVVAASSSATFTGTTTSTVEHLNASDFAGFSDFAGVSVLLPSGLTVPGGDQSAGLRQVLYSPLSREYPLSFAESPEGLLLAANGVDSPIAWDGYSANAWAAGVTAPDQVVWMDGSGSGSILGRRWAYLRYVDVRGNYSNLGQISDPIDLGRDAFINNVSYSSSGVVSVTSYDHGLVTGDEVSISGVLGLPAVNGLLDFEITVVDNHTFTLNDFVLTSGTYISGGVWTSGAAAVAYSHVEVPTDPKIARRQILRNLAGDASVFYVDIDTTDVTSTTFSSGLTDEQLATRQPVPVLWTNRANAADRLFQGDSPAAMRFGLPPSFKCAVAAYAGRMFAASDLVYSSGAIQSSLGSPYVLGIGTGFTSAFAGRLLYVNGSGQPPAVIESVMVTQQILVLQTPYAGASVPMGQYSIRPAPVERSLVYYSEPHLPEAWPSWNAFSVPETDDEITGLAVFKSFLFILKERNVFKLAYKNDPGRDGYVFPCVRRGCVNNRCAVYVDDSVYMLDEMGVHRFDGDTTEPISQAIDAVFRPDGTSSYQVDWTTSRVPWHASHDQTQHLIRWHLDLVGFASLEYSVCFDYRLNQWWLESYAERISSSCLGVVSGYRRSALGTTARRVMCAGLGSLDGVQESVNGTLSGTVTQGDTLTLTDACANFPPNLAGVPVVLASGTGLGQTAVISSNTSTTLSLVRPLDVAPDSTTAYQVGGVSWAWKSSWRRIEEDEEENPRDLEIVWRPTQTDACMVAELFYDHSSEPYPWAYDIDRDGISIRQGASAVAFDLTSPRGYAIQRLSGHRDPYGYGHHYLAVQLSGAQGANPTTVYQVLMDGAE